MTMQAWPPPIERTPTMQPVPVPPTRIVLSIQQVRRWTTPPPWAPEGYTSTQDVFYLRDVDRNDVQLPPGGWTLSASDLLRIRWSGPPHEECMYNVDLNQCRVYTGLWTPKILETVTESFFCAGDLWAINYRLLRVTAGD